MKTAREEALLQEFLALPRDQWPGKAYRVVGESMKASVKAEQKPDQVWDDALADLKAVLLELDQKNIYRDVSEWLVRTCKPYWDERKRGERAVKAARLQAGAKPEHAG